MLRDAAWRCSYLNNTSRARNDHKQQVLQPLPTSPTLPLPSLSSILFIPLLPIPLLLFSYIHYHTPLTFSSLFPLFILTKTITGRRRRRRRRSRRRGYASLEQGWQASALLRCSLMTKTSLMSPSMKNQSILSSPLSLLLS